MDEMNLLGRCSGFKSAYTSIYQVSDDRKPNTLRAPHLHVSTVKWVIVSKNDSMPFTKYSPSQPGVLNQVWRLQAQSH